MILIDGNHVFCRNLFANKDEIKENPNFLSHLLLNTIISVCDQFGASKKERVVIALDSNSWRKEFYEKNKKEFPDLINESYKGNRKRDSDIDWKSSFEILEKVTCSLKEFSDYFVIKVDGAEGDDIIAVLTNHFKNQENIWIISSDKDFTQLQDVPRVNIYDPIKKSFRPKTDSEIFKKIHILIGDSSDNIKPVRPRLGEKTALKMLKDLDDTLKTNPVFRKRFEFNKKLIDLDEIPKEIQDSIIAEFERQKFSFDGIQLLKIFSELKLVKIAENINKFKLSDSEIKTKLNSKFDFERKIDIINKQTLEDFFK